MAMPLTMQFDVAGDAQLSRAITRFPDVATDLQPPFRRIPSRFERTERPPTDHAGAGPSARPAAFLCHLPPFISGTAPVAAGGAEGADVSGIGPAPVRGLVYTQQFTGLAKGDPEGGECL